MVIFNSYVSLPGVFLKRLEFLEFVGCQRMARPESHASQECPAAKDGMIRPWDSAASSIFVHTLW